LLVCIVSAELVEGDVALLIRQLVSLGRSVVVAEAGTGMAWERTLSRHICLVVRKTRQSRELEGVSRAHVGRQ
jgi:hypothetical protein